jgi:PAS domain S-box-containing protein
MTYRSINDSTAASVEFESDAKISPAAARHLLPRVWLERSWAVAVLFASLLIGSWTVVIANELNQILGNINWLRVATSAILTGLLPVVALLVLYFAWRHRDASAALALAESRVRDMVEASSDWLWEMGPDLRFTSICDRMPGMNAADISRLIGKTWHEAVDTGLDSRAWSRHADDLARHRAFRDFAYLDKTSSGELRWRKVSGRPFFDQRGRFQGYRGTGTDVTEQMQAEIKLRKALKDRQESEDKFRALITDFPGAVYRCQCDPDMTMQFVNDAVEDLCGYSAADLCNSRMCDYSSLIHAGDRTTIERAVMAAASQRQPFAIEYRILHKDGTIRWVYDKGRAAVGEDGQPRRVDGAIFDITDRKAVEAALIRAKNAAESGSRAKSEFLALMSHEFRTPLNAIIGFSDLVRSEVYGPIGNDLYKEYVQDIMASGNHLLALINDILDLSKAEAGKISLNEAPAAVAEIARDSVAMLRQQAGDARVALECNIAADLSPLLCDERLVKQMLLNLLSNAVKFTPVGGRVRLDADVTGEGLRLVVRDTGIGIADADLPKALAPFGRVDGEFGRKHAGTGLGLPLTKHLAEAHGARFAIDSEVGVGTTVTIVFPRARLLSRAA